MTTFNTHTNASKRAIGNGTYNSGNNRARGIPAREFEGTVCILPKANHKNQTVTLTIAEVTPSMGVDPSKCYTKDTANDLFARLQQLDNAIRSADANVLKDPTLSLIASKGYIYQGYKNVTTVEGMPSNYMLMIKEHKVKGADGNWTDQTTRSVYLTNKQLSATTVTEYGSAL